MGCSKGGRVLVGSLEGQRPIGEPRLMWDNIKTGRQEIRWGRGID